MCGWWWSKGILEFRFGPNLGLGLEAWTKLNNINYLVFNIVHFFEVSQSLLHFPHNLPSVEGLANI